MHKRLHTIWGMILTLAALLLSGVAASSPLIPLQEFAYSQTAVVPDSEDMHCDSSHENVENDHHENEPHADTVSEHHCSSGNSVSSYTVLPSLSYALLRTSNLVLISDESTNLVSSVADTLYRPPIA